MLGQSLQKPWWMLEIHPLDSIRRVPPPLVRKHPQQIQVCDDGVGQTPTAIDIDIPTQPPAPPTDYSQIHFREIVDDRFTDMSTVNTHVVEVDPCDPTQLHVQVKINSQGHFKAVYLVWWQEELTKRPPIAWQGRSENLNRRNWESAPVSRICRSAITPP